MPSSAWCYTVLRTVRIPGLFAVYSHRLADFRRGNPPRSLSVLRRAAAARCHRAPVGYTHYSTGCIYPRVLGHIMRCSAPGTIVVIPMRGSRENRHPGTCVRSIVPMTIPLCPYLPQPSRNAADTFVPGIPAACFHILTEYFSASLFLLIPSVC
jgi:hypothetical protein